MDLNTALEGFWLDKEMNLADETIIRYGRVFDSFVDFMGGCNVNEIESKDIKRYLAHLTKNTNLSKRSIFDSYMVLSSFFSWCEVELDIEHVIRGKVDAPKYTKKKIKPVPMANVQKMLKAITAKKHPQAKRNRAIIIALVDSGLRVTELSDLRIKDYDRKRGRLHVKHGKGDKERFVFVGKRCQKAIWLYLASRRDPLENEYLFCTRTNTRLDRYSIRRILFQAAEFAEVDRASPHKFRHTFAIEFLRAGGNPFELKEILGHERLDMVLEYAQLAETDLEDAARRSSPADKYKL